MAPDFTLTDAVTGQPFALSAQRGHVVALAFLYTHCPDTCPLTAERFREAQKALGADRARVQFVAVAVDPAPRAAAIRSQSDPCYGRAGVTPDR